MNVTRKSSGGLTTVPLESFLLMQRKVFLCDPGGIDAVSANELIQKLLYLQSEDSTEPISIYINSPGGEVMSGLMIYDQLKSMQTPVNLYCTGLAASMAAILLAGGQKGRRFILPHSKVMIHEPLITGGLGGSATTIQRTAESILEVRRITAGLLAADTGRSIEEIEAAISFDNYMNAEEAVAFGLCDEIVPGI